MLTRAIPPKGPFYSFFLPQNRESLKDNTRILITHSRASGLHAVHKQLDESDELGEPDGTDETINRRSARCAGWKAKIVGVAPSTVSDFITLLPESLTDLRELSVELKKQKSAVFEAKTGAELRSRTTDLGVEIEGVESFAESAEKMRT